MATRLSVCTATVYSLCSCGLLRFTRVSGALRIDPASVEVFIADGGPGPVADRRQCSSPSPEPEGEAIARVEARAEPSDIDARVTVALVREQAFSFAS